MAGKKTLALGTLQIVAVQVAMVLEPIISLAQEYSTIRRRNEGKAMSVCFLCHNNKDSGKHYCLAVEGLHLYLRLIPAWVIDK